MEGLEKRWVENTFFEKRRLKMYKIGSYLNHTKPVWFLIQFFLVSVRFQLYFLWIQNFKISISIRFKLTDWSPVRDASLFRCFSRFLPSHTITFLKAYSSRPWSRGYPHFISKRKELLFFFSLGYFRNKVLVNKTKEVNILGKKKTKGPPWEMTG